MTSIGVEGSAIRAGRGVCECVVFKYLLLFYCDNTVSLSVIYSEFGTELDVYGLPSIWILYGDCCD